MLWRGGVRDVLGAAARRVPLVREPTRLLSTTPGAWKKSAPARGRARKSPRTLLRMYEEGKLRGAEAAGAAALLKEAEDTSRTAEPGVSQAAASASAAEPAGAFAVPDTMTLGEARRIIRAVEAARPRNAYELQIVTSVPPNQTNAFRGRIVYPREPRIRGEVVLVFAEQGSDAEAAAKRAAEQLAKTGSSMKLVIGGTEMIGDTASGRVPAFTRVLSTTGMLPQLGKTLARQLGPKGLMPSVKRGTAAEDGDEMMAAVEQLVAGVDWRGDRTGVVRGAVGRISFSEGELRENVHALLDSVIGKAAGGLGGTKASTHVIAGYARDAPGAHDGDVARRGPSSLKKAMNIVRNVYLTSTQGPGIRLHLDDVL
ncbi:hypothetical protein MSPP1_000407 [Malassezia sp. CBS 17886]|nr:hypothetical protein MSPP1_000407 [Malassezia sp. CBS 17886]